MAHKKKTPSNAKPDSDSEVSKAQAISDTVTASDFDTPDAAMADTSLEEATESATEEAADAVIENVPEEALDAEVVPDDVTNPEPASEPTIAASPRSKQKSGFFGTFLGGVVAAVIGFGGAIYFEAAEWPVFGGSAGEDLLQAQLAEQTSALESVTAQLEELKTNISEGQTADGAALGALTARLDALPTTSAELMPEDLRALLAKQKAEMDALQANLDQMSELTEGQIASAQAQQESAAAAEARAKARGALNAVRTALSAGGAYSAALPDIAAATNVPEVLQANADTGVPSAETLEDGFGEAARTALSASLKAAAGDAPSERVFLFLKDQLGARSLTPQEGGDPDAVLSRVEASMRSGDIAGALDTISALPEAGQAALQGWADMATTRKDALAAFDSLADALSAN